MKERCEMMSGSGEKVPIANGVFSPVCKKKCRGCHYGCRCPQPPCDKLLEWTRMHGVEGLHSNPEDYYIYWDSFLMICKRNGEEITV